MDFLFCDKFETRRIGWREKRPARRRNRSARKSAAGQRWSFSAGIKFDSVTPVAGAAQGASHGRYKRLKVLTFT